MSEGDADSYEQMMGRCRAGVVNRTALSLVPRAYLGPRCRAFR